MLYVLKPSHDSRNCVKVVSVSHCASVKYEMRQRELETHGSLVEGMASTG